MKAVLVFVYEFPDDARPDLIFQETIDIAREKFKDDPTHREIYMGIGASAEKITDAFEQEEQL